MRNPTYEKILIDLASGELTVLQRQVYDLLKKYPDGLSRENLVFMIYGYLPVRLDANADDRKIRKAIERLRQRLFPIVSTSAKPGYRLDFSRQAVAKMLAELQSRRDHIQEQINSAAKFYQLPEYLEPIKATQERML
jgi:biotin operon repressor